MIAIQNARDEMRVTITGDEIQVTGTQWRNRQQVLPLLSPHHLRRHQPHLCVAQDYSIASLW
jgi:hypothetical protein